MYSMFFFFNGPATTEIYTLSLHDALPICSALFVSVPSSDGTSSSLLEALAAGCLPVLSDIPANRSEEHTSELQSHSDLVCRLLLEKKNNTSRYARRAPARPGSG